MDRVAAAVEGHRRYAVYFKSGKEEGVYKTAGAILNPSTIVTFCHGEHSAWEVGSSVPVSSRTRGPEASALFKGAACTVHALWA